MAFQKIGHCFPRFNLWPSGYPEFFVKVKFHGIDLDVDIVPIYAKGEGDWGGVD
ncbi:MAG: hypothetical protein OXC02_05685 [Rhodobacteraceae bacterium]|nr:hypothetical protein [Paracoccaceae bacterium]